MVNKKKPPIELIESPRCDRKRCMIPAQMFPIIVIAAPKWAVNQKAKIEMELPLNVCPKHAIEDLDLFMDDAGYMQLVQGLAVRKLPRPDRKSMRVIFRALEDRQVQQ